MESLRTEDVAQCAYCKASYLYSEWKYNMIKTAQVSAGKKENSSGFESGCKHLNISQCRENTPSVKWEKLLVRPQDGFTAHLDQFSPCVADRFAKSLDHMILWIHLARVQAMHFWLNQSVVFNELLAATGGLDVECGLFYQNWQVYVIERRAKINTEGFLDDMFSNMSFVDHCSWLVEVSSNYQQSFYFYRSWPFRCAFSDSSE